HAVGAQAHVDPRLLHGGDGGDAAAQLQVAHGVVDCGDPLFGHDGPVLGGSPHAVGRDGPAVPHAVVVQNLDVGLAVGGQALLVLASGLGDVHVPAQVVLPGVAGHLLPQLLVGGVLPVDGGVHQHLAVVVAVPLLGQLPLHPAVVVGVGVEVVG